MFLPLFFKQMHESSQTRTPQTKRLCYVTRTMSKWLHSTFKINTTLLFPPTIPLKGERENIIMPHSIKLVIFCVGKSVLGLQRLVDIIDNIDNKKLSTNIFFVELFDLIWPNVRACNTAVWPAWCCSARLVQPSWMQFKRRPRFSASVSVTFSNNYNLIFCYKAALQCGAN